MYSNETSVSRSASYRMADSGERIHLVDVRTPAEYRQGHAIGALSLPLESLDAERLTARLGKGAGTRNALHLICASGQRAQQAARRLRGQGLDNLFVVDGGTMAWVTNKLPMKRKAGRLSLERQARILTGMLILLMLAKGTLLHPLFYILSGLLGAWLIVAGDAALRRFASFLERMPWNRLQSGHPASA